MMQKKIPGTVQKFAIAFLFFILLFLFSCGTDQGEKLAYYNFKQGVAELQLNFRENAPPERIYPNSDFKLILEADNQMAYDIEEGKVWITGILGEYFEVTPLEQNFQEVLQGEPFAGRSLTTPAGTKVFFEFQGHAFLPFQNAEQQTNPFFLKAQYRSRAEFQDTFCLNTNLYAVYDASCSKESREDAKSYSGQGAPVGVSEVEVVTSPGVGAQVEFRVRLRNFGKGKIERIDIVRAQLGKEEISCNFPGASGEYKGSVVATERVDSGSFYSTGGISEALLLCKKPLEAQTSYETTLQLEFSYLYLVQEQKQLNLWRGSTREFIG